MENQINVGNQNAQQFGQNPINQQPVDPFPEKPKVNYWMISTILLVIAFVAVSFWYFTDDKQVANLNPNNVSRSEDAPTVFPTPTDSVNVVNNNPKLAVFMREGMVYAKNFDNNEESKVSRTIKVGSPNLSLNGKYVIYFSINHAAGGFPRSDVFIADVSGTYEKRLGITNEFASKTSWSKDGNYLGLILFADENPSSSDFYAEALLYDAMAQKDITRSRINLGQDLSTDQYDVKFECATLEVKYVTFCNEFVAIAKAKQALPELDYSYKADQYRNSNYTKAGYKLRLSYKITDDLVVLEYFTGEPKNPESQWGIAGGVFVPGYDEGVTQTYSVLLNEKTNKAITEILNAVSVKFIL